MGLEKTKVAFALPMRKAPGGRRTHGGYPKLADLFANTASRVGRRVGQAEGRDRASLERDAHGVLDLVEGISRSLDRIRAAQARAAHLRLPEFAVLSVVRSAGEEGITVSDAAIRLGVRPQALSGPVAELAAQDLLSREKDPTDGRARRLKVTLPGIERLSRSAPVRQRLVRELLARVPAPNVALLVLTRLEAALGQTLDGEPA